MVLSLTACGGADNNQGAVQETADAADGEEAAGTDAAEPSGAPVELNVTTTFAGEDTNAQNF